MSCVSPSPSPPMISLPAYMLTAAGREEILAGTLARWAAAGGGEAPAIHYDPTPRGRTAISRIMGGWRSLLKHAAWKSGSKYVLLLEDDLDFVPGFRERMAGWKP